jgi:hypothetical protein
LGGFRLLCLLRDQGVQRHPAGRIEWLKMSASLGFNL